MSALLAVSIIVATFFVGGFVGFIVCAMLDASREPPQRPRPWSER